MNTNKLQLFVNKWQEETFTEKSAESIVAHLQREVKELAEDPYDYEEIADCLILLIGLAGHINVDVEKIILDKMVENYLRTWGEPDEEGVVEHV